MLHKDGRISNIVHYGKGSWTTPLTGLLSTKEIDLNTYAKIVWNSNGSVFSMWYGADASSNATPIRAVGAIAVEVEGDCIGASMEIQAERIAALGMNQLQQGGYISNLIGGEKAKSPEYSDGWVATQKGGFSWRKFENVAYIGNDMRMKPLAMPAQYAPLAEQMKSRWSKLEGETVEGMGYAPAAHHTELKGEIQDTPFSNFAIERVVSSRGKITLLFFHARKYFNSPVFRDYVESQGSSVGDTTQVIAYRGWVLLEPEGRVSWPAAFVNLTPGYGSKVSSYRQIHPIALIELDGDTRQYLLASSNVEYGNGGISQMEIFELTHGKFKSHGTYPGSCG